MPLRTALVVDDDPSVLELLVALMGDEGFDVTSAPTVAEALLEFRSASPVDLLVVDVQLPDGDGIDLANELTRDHPDLEVIVISTGPVGSRETHRIAKVGFFIAKEAGFPDALRRTLTRYRARRGPE